MYPISTPSLTLSDFRKSNLEEVDKMQEELQKAGYRRTADNLRAVFFKNKNFLTYNASCTSKDLVAIMADHYETMEAEHQLLADRNPIRTREPVSESALEKRKNMSHYTSKGGEFLDVCSCFSNERVKFSGIGTNKTKTI